MVRKSSLIVLGGASWSKAPHGFFDEFEIARVEIRAALQQFVMLQLAYEQFGAGHWKPLICSQWLYNSWF